jgi:hypothetical protein
MKSSCHLFFNHHGMPAKFSESNSSVSVPHGTNLYSLLLTSALTAHWFPHWLTHCHYSLTGIAYNSLQYTHSLTQSQIHSLASSQSLIHYCTLSGIQLTDQLGWFAYIVPERSERTRRKHRLRHPFYCRVTYHVIIQASHWSAGRRRAENGLLPLRNRCWRHLLGYRVTTVAQCLEQIRHNTICIAVSLTELTKRINDLWSIFTVTRCKNWWNLRIKDHQCNCIN